MPDSKVTVESGRFDWQQGRGYQAPANAPPGKHAGIPPGWGLPPHLQAPSLPPPPHEEHPDLLPPEMVQGPTPPDIDLRTEPTGAFNPEGIAAMMRPDVVPIATVDELLNNLKPLPKERVNLDNNTAMFMGHEIVLSKEAQDYIKCVLAAEVSRVLREEEARVLSAVQFPALPGGSTTGGTNVPEVPGATGPVESNAQSGAGAVQ